METSANSPASLVVDDKSVSKNGSSKQKKAFRFSKDESSSSKKEGKRISVFLVDDDPLYLKALELSISSHMDSVNIQSFQTGEACLHQMKNKPVIVILDYQLNSEIPYAWNGMSILKQIKKISPKTKVIMLSSQDSLKVAIDCMNNGAYDYISKTQTALIRINNIIDNIAGNLEVNSVFFRICQYIALIIALIIIASIILNH